MVVVAVQRGLNPTKTLVGFVREKRLAAGRRDKVKRFEERDRVRRVFAAPPMACWEMMDGYFIFYATVIYARVWL